MLAVVGAALAGLCTWPHRDGAPSRVQVRCSAANGAPRRGDTGYKRAVAREALRQALSGQPGSKRSAVRNVVRELRELRELRANRDQEPQQTTATLAVASEDEETASEPACAAELPSIEPACAALCTPAELAPLAELRRAIAASTPTPGDADWRADVHGDVRLLRFLRKHGSVEDAAARYAAMLDWRRERRVDEAPVALGCTAADFEHHNELYRLMRCTTVTSWARGDTASAGSDDDLLTMHLGRWDTHGLVGAVETGRLSVEQFERYWVCVNEMFALSLDGHSRAHGRLVGLRLVCDFSGTSWRQFSRPFLDIMARWAAVADFYPSTSVEILFVNAPSFFKMVSGTASPRCSARRMSFPRAPHCPTLLPPSVSLPTVTPLRPRYGRSSGRSFSLSSAKTPAPRSDSHARTKPNASSPPPPRRRPRLRASRESRVTRDGTCDIDHDCRLSAFAFSSQPFKTQIYVPCGKCQIISGLPPPPSLSLSTKTFHGHTPSLAALPPCRAANFLS